MKRRTEHLVEKRDGRTEFLRATKLARSIHLALHSVGVDEDWRALELANVVLMGLRQRQQAGGDTAVATAPLPTSTIGEAVQHLLVVTGQSAAAVAYSSMAAERARRRGALALLARNQLPVGQLPVGIGPMSPVLSRLPRGFGDHDGGGSSGGNPNGGLRPQVD